MSEIIDGKYTDWKKDVNCHAYCPYGKMCRYCKGDTGIVVDECSMYYKLDDINNEAKEYREEKERAFEECDDW